MRIYKDITPKQRKILKFIQSKISEEGRPPTIREIAVWFGFKSTGTVRDYLKALTQKGHIKLTPRKSRALELVKKVAFRIPIITKTTTNKASHFDYEEAQDYLNLEELLSSQGRDVFASKVTDNSMAGKNLYDGDLALIKRLSLANDGDIVASLIDNQVVLRILRKRQDRVYLEAANNQYSPISKGFKILGKVIASIRKYD
ncbi:MAG: transcriptional repressor LexA [Candidatus Omnitrophica bacterium]|nr:transcriptional repressor LexA [Candidatus Omnitrophota bacterium]